MQGVLHLLEFASSTFEECQVEWGISMHMHLHRGCKSAYADAGCRVSGLALYVVAIWMNKQSYKFCELVFTRNSFHG